MALSLFRLILDRQMYYEKSQLQNLLRLNLNKNVSFSKSNFFTSLRYHFIYFF